MLLYRSGGGYGRRLIFSGLSFFVYYFAMLLLFMVHGIFWGWGDVAYHLIWLWPIFGFFVGVAASTLVEKVFRPQAVNG
jgi:hypothetical protein